MIVIDDTCDHTRDDDHHHHRDIMMVMMTRVNMIKDADGDNDSGDK